MSESTPPSPSGQIESPNPLELFWEKHRRLVITVVAAVVCALGIKYGIAYYEQAKTDALWGEFATASNLDRQYVSPDLPEALQLFIGQLDTHPYERQGLVTMLEKQLAAADGLSIEQALAEAAGTPAEPLLLWVAAHRALGNRDWDEATAYLNDLQGRFPDHPFCVETDYPVQYREPVESEDEDPDAHADPDHVHELEPEVSGSLVGAALRKIQRQREFEQQEPRFYQPIDPPEDSPRVRVNTSLGSFTLALFEDRAPDHAKHFLELVDAGFYVDQNIDEIARTPGGFEGAPVQELHFGLPSSKDQDRTTWDTTAPSETILDFVDTEAQRELSHFPGTLAAAPEAEGKSSGERFWINVNDCGARYDGERVIVGRVVEGLDVLDLIVNTPFSTDTEAQAGRGKPRENIRIDSIERL